MSFKSNQMRKLLESNAHRSNTGMLTGEQKITVNAADFERLIVEVESFEKENKQLQSKIAALSIAIADNDIDEVKRLLPLSGEQVTNELNSKVGRLEDQLIRLQARLQERFEFVLGDIGTDLQAEYERSLDIINESGSQALLEIKADTVNNLFFPVAIRKMWTGYEVNLWLSEQANQLRKPEQEK